MKILKTIILVVLLAGFTSTFTSCDTNDDGNEPAFQGLNSGFLIVSNAGGTRFVRYSAEMPTGTFDVSAGQSFEEFTNRDQFRNQLFLNSTISEEGIEKFIVNESGELESVANLPTVGNAFPITVVDENTGYYGDANNLDEIVIFNPGTMQVSGSIDMSAAYTFEEATFENFGGITIRGNDMFFPYRPRVNNQLAFDSLIYHVVDLSTNSYVKTIYLDGHIEPRVFNEPADEQGNIYHLTAGNRTFPNTIKPSIVKIPAGSTEFDEDYDFRPINELPGGEQILIQLLDRFVYHENGIAFALGTVKVPDAVIQIIQGAGGFQNLTREETDQIRALLASEPSAGWLRLDLNAQTVTVIDDIPLSSPFTSLREKIDGDFYFGSTSNNLNAVYRYNPNTQVSEEVFRITESSGDIFQIIDLSKE